MIDKIPKHKDFEKPKTDLINKAKRKFMLLSLCDFANDIYNKTGWLGFVDNLPGLLAAITGFENVLPQIGDVDVVELTSLQTKVKERLELTEGAELVTEKALSAVWGLGELVKAIKSLKEPPEDV